MIQLVKTDRKPNFTGVTPAFVACATLFFCVLIAGHLAGRHFNSDLTPCVFKLVTGEPCVLCGGSRASFYLASGHPFNAFRYNPLVTVLLCYAALALVLKFAFARKITLGEPLRDRRFLWVVAVAVVLANWVYIVRILE